MYIAGYIVFSSFFSFLFFSFFFFYNIEVPSIKNRFRKLCYQAGHSLKLEMHQLSGI